MKIENGSLPPSADQVGKAAGLSGDAGQARPASGSATGDAVHVSGDAHLLARAAGAVGDVAAPDTVRPDVVERAKAALARGEVGADVDRLADRIIDGLLDE